MICWTQSYEPRLEFRAEIGMKQEDPGPILTKGRLNRARRDELSQVAEEVVPLIDEGLEALSKAIEVDSDYDDAMAYVNLLYREKRISPRRTRKPRSFWPMRTNGSESA